MHATQLPWRSQTAAPPPVVEDDVEDAAPPPAPELEDAVAVPAPLPPEPPTLVPALVTPPWVPEGSAPSSPPTTTWLPQPNASSTTIQDARRHNIFPS